jgi:hypothetical protein
MGDMEDLCTNSRTFRTSKRKTLGLKVALPSVQYRRLIRKMSRDKKIG